MPRRGAGEDVGGDVAHVAVVKIVEDDLRGGRWRGQKRESCESREASGDGRRKRVAEES